MAQDLGKRLLAEVQEVGLDEILRELRLRHNARPAYFSLEALDKIWRVIAEVRAPSTSKLSAQPPVVEISSPGPGGGKTHLLYLLTAIAVLPSHLGGRQACVAIFDLDGSFSVPRLAQQIAALLLTQDSTTTSEAHQRDTISSALDHVHIFRPQSLASTIATLTALPSYFLHSSHPSRDRSLAFIALDSASAFYWQARTDEETTAFEQQTGSSSPSHESNRPLASHAQVAAALKTASLRLNTSILLTSRNPNNTTSSSATNHSGAVRSIRASLPVPLSNLPTLRLIVQRLPVRKFPASLSVREALLEAENRQRAVDESKFECVVNEWGLEPRVIEKVHSEGLGFGFRIREGGVLLDGREKGA